MTSKNVSHMETFYHFYERHYTGKSDLLKDYIEQVCSAFVWEINIILL